MLYRRKPDEIEAVQITDSAFNGAHPNNEHIKGVTYDPVGMVCRLNGGVAVVGDYILQPVGCDPYFSQQFSFEKTHEPVN